MTEIIKREQIRELMKWACIHGMMDEVLTFPINLDPVEVTEDSLKQDYPKLPELVKDSSSAARPLTVFDNPDLKLESLFSNGVLLRDEDHDGLPDTSNFRIVLPEETDEFLIQALCDLTARIAASCTSMNSDLLADGVPEGNLIVFENSGEPSISWEDADGRAIVHINGSGKELSAFMALFCTKFDSDLFCPMIEKTWQLNQALQGKTWDGQRAFIVSHSEKAEYYADCTEEEADDYSMFKICGLKSPHQTWQRAYKIPFEIDELQEEIQDAKIDPDQPCVIQAAVSKDIPVRRKLKEKLASLYPKADIELINAYKPGFSWLEEVCIPAMKNRNIDHVRILFKPYLQPGQTEWNDEDGAVPKRGDASMKYQQEWMELPIRFLQELYPIDDVIAEELKISRDVIAFESSDDLDWTYQIKAYSGIQQVYDNHYQVRTYERNYLDAYPDAGLVHPEPAYVTVIQNEVTLMDVMFPTERDHIWNLFQTDTLPHLRETILNQHPKGITVEDQPLFSRLKFSILLNETDRSLNCRQDRIAPVDALQEDLYFTALEYFKYLGKELCGVPLDSPGLIEPDIRFTQGASMYGVVLEQPLRVHACMESENGTQDMNTLISPCALMKVYLHQNKLVYQYRVEGMTDEYRDYFMRCLKKGSLDMSEAMSDLDYIQFNDGPVDAVHHKKKVPLLHINSVDLHESEVIGYDTMKSIMQKLNHVLGLRVIELAQSVQHRTIYGVILTRNEKGLVTKARMLRYRPSVILNCRHHANEVSSTNSSLMLIRKILTDPEFQNMPDRMNLVIIPMENPDGSAIHERLSKINPCNKLHVARYNALGREFAHDSMKSDSIHTEAHAMYRLYRETLPDVFIDDHGVPTHEWEQPYSGYTSPSFKGFWLPRSILYGYFWTSLDEVYQSNQLLCNDIADAVADAVNEDAELAEENKEWQNRFEKYAHAWMPKLFPADYYKGMINYWIGRLQSDSQLYYSHRFPWLTTVYYTSEVADETAEGSYLDLCARTHLLEDTAILKLIESAKKAYNINYVESPRGIRISIQRRRPLYL